MIILCYNEDNLNELSDDLPIFSVNTRLPKAEQILNKVKRPGIYFDIGGGMGMGSVQLDNKEIDSSHITMDGQFKIGYGPFGRIPLYAVLHSSFTLAFSYGDSFIDENGYEAWKEYLGFPLYVGAGFIIYPLRPLQLGFSCGLVMPFETGGNEPGYDYWTIGSGFSYNISAAYDIGKRNNGFLIGLQYTFTSYDVEYYSQNFILNNPKIGEGTMTTSYFSIFLKYAYRRKVPSQVDW